MRGFPGVAAALSLSSTSSSEAHRTSSRASRETVINQVWVMAVTFGGFSLVMLILVLTTGDMEFFQRVMMYAMLVLLLVGFASSLFMIYKFGQEEDKAETPAGPYSCKHCSAKFSSKRIWRSHERSCVEMKVW